MNGICPDNPEIEPHTRLDSLTSGDLLTSATCALQQVRLTRVGSHTALIPRDPQVKPPAAQDLVYLTPSPDFCRLDPDNGIHGTARRRCNEPHGWNQMDVNCRE
ncbi:protein Wnt-4-like [Carassius gibelio]|uniref:protein Wnt-4-like n=1 Tax=Carassius gibelio TaxID=101364 RepID=UPI0022778496|nr:protein Wnt-4-like [Carassius gibelio]